MKQLTNNAGRILADAIRERAKNLGYRGNLANQLTKAFVQDVINGDVKPEDLEQQREIVTDAVDILTGRKL